MDFRRAQLRYSTAPGNVSSKNWVGIYPDDGGATIGKKNSFTCGSAFCAHAISSMTWPTLRVR